MNDDQLRQIVLQGLTEIAPEIEGEEITPDVNFRDQLDIDSMDFLNFIIALHEELKVDIPEADYSQLFDLNGAVAYLKAKVD